MPQGAAFSGGVLFLLLVIAEWLGAGLRVHAAVVVASPHVTLVVYSDKHLDDAEWTALKAALQTSFENVALESHGPAGGFEVIRGERLSAGVVFDVTPIPVYLHGECRLVGQPAPQDVHGPLGWVLRDGGHIEPFIHVDCTRLSEMLAQRALWMKNGARTEAIAEAVAHVVLHEWIHIATQSAAHTRSGISKEAFSLSDLMPGYVRILPHAGGK